MYRDLIINLALIISFLAITSELFKEKPMSFNRKYQIIDGLLTGSLGLLLMYFSIKVTDFIIMDLRNFTIILAFLYGGPVSGVIAAIICSIGRVLIYGINIASITAVFSFILISIICGFIVKTKLADFQKFLWMNLGSIMVAFVALSYLIDSQSKLTEALIYYGLISLIGGLIIYYISKYIVQSNENFRRLRLFQKVIETTQQGVFITDREAKILFINDAFSQITGYTFDEVKGQNPRILKSGKQDVSFYKQMWEHLSNTGQWQGEIWNRNKYGKDFPELLNISKLTDKYGETVNYVAVLSDISEMKEAEQKLVEANSILKNLSSLDGLTGISNRRTFDDALDKEWNLALTNGYSLSIVLFDIDFFKKFNDTYGHLEGDECIKSVAAELSKIIRGSNYFGARYGGEEFAIILPNTNLEIATAVGERVRNAVEILNIPHIHSQYGNHVTISVGVATLIADPSISPVQLVHHADQALYSAKDKGRNRVDTYCNC